MHDAIIGLGEHLFKLCYTGGEAGDFGGGSIMHVGNCALSDSLSVTRSFIAFVKSGCGSS